MIEVERDVPCRLYCFRDTENKTIAVTDEFYPAPGRDGKYNGTQTFIGLTDKLVKFIKEMK